MGQADAEPIQPSHATLEARVIDHAVPCLSCGYDLQGLLTTAVCPECAFPAHVSVAEDHRLPASYLRALAIGMWLTLAPLCMFVLLLVLPLLHKLLSPSTQSWIAALLWYHFPISLIPWAMGVCSLAFVRSPIPEGSRDTVGRSGMRVGWYALLTLGFAISLSAIRYVPAVTAGLPIPARAGMNPGLVIAVVCGELLVLCQMITSIRLGDQLQSKPLRDSANALIYCSIPSSVILLLYLLGWLEPMEGAVGGLLFAAGIAGSLACAAAVVLVCLHTRSALNRLRVIRKNLIASNARATAGSMAAELSS